MFTGSVNTIPSPDSLVATALAANSPFTVILVDDLSAKLLEMFNGALTPEMIDYLVRATNQLLQGLHGAAPEQIEELVDERRRVETELSNLVEFVVKGAVSSPRLRDEIRAREHRLAELDRQLGQLQAAAPAPMEIDRPWVERRLEALKELLVKDPAGARREIQKPEARRRPSSRSRARDRLTGREDHWPRKD